MEVEEKEGYRAGMKRIRRVSATDASRRDRDAPRYLIGSRVPRIPLDKASGLGLGRRLGAIPTVWNVARAVILSLVDTWQSSPDGCSLPLSVLCHTPHPSRRIALVAFEQRPRRSLIS